MRRPWTGWLVILALLVGPDRMVVAGPAEGDGLRAVGGVRQLDRRLAMVEGPGTFVHAPYTLYRTLAMTLAGARGATAEQIAQVLGRPAERNFGPDLASLEAERQEYHGARGPVFQAERMWVQAGYPVLPAFTDRLRNQGLEAAGRLDFAADPEQARQDLNQWVAEATHHKVPALFPAGTIAAETRLVLASTAYFHGRWAESFARAQTRNQPFHGLSATRPVPLMHRAGTMLYAEGDSFQLVELPFDDGLSSLVVVLPAPGPLATATHLVFSETLDVLLDQLVPRTVELFLPRFTIASTRDLSALLGAMGMPAAFSRAEADFSGISGNQDLFLSSVQAGVTLIVNEEGAEAAAATGAVVAEKGMGPSTLPPVLVRADRPFFFFLRDTATGLRHFSGCLAEAPE